MKFDLNLYSEYRTELMGLATIMVVVSHAYMSGMTLSNSARMVTGLGASGVELFLFVSGFGLWKSLFFASNRTFDFSLDVLSSWYKRRYLRILVPYLIFAIPIYGILTILDHQGIVEYIRRVFFVSFWTHGWGLWYIAMLLPLYFVAPLLIKLLSGKWKVFWFVILLLITELFSYFAFGGNRDVYFSRFIIQRIPSFLIGIMMAEAICESKKISIWWVLFLPLLCYVVLWRLNHTIGTRFFYLWLLPLPFSTVAVLLFERAIWLQSLCKFLGTISLEVYCAHIFVPMILMQAFHITASWSMYLLGVCISVILAVGIAWISSIALACISGVKKG